MFLIHKIKIVYYNSVSKSYLSCFKQFISKVTAILELSFGGRLLSNVAGVVILSSDDHLDFIQVFYQ